MGPEGVELNAPTTGAIVVDSTNLNIIEKQKLPQHQFGHNKTITFTIGAVEVEISFMFVIET